MTSLQLTSVVKPARLKRSADAAMRLIQTMKELGKPVSSVALSAADYNEMLALANRGREKDGLQPYTRIEANGVEVRRA